MDRAYIIAACIAVLILFALLWYRANVKTQETAVELVGTLHSKYKDNKAPAPTHHAAPAPTVSYTHLTLPTICSV